jgi:hypothetical protein
MASLRSSLLDICSADSFEDFTEIHGFGEMLFVHISSADSFQDFTKKYGIKL